MEENTGSLQLSADTKEFLSNMHYQVCALVTEAEFQHPRTARTDNRNTEGAPKGLGKFSGVLSRKSIAGAKVKSLLNMMRDSEGRVGSKRVETTAFTIASLEALKKEFGINQEEPGVYHLAHKEVEPDISRLKAFYSFLLTLQGILRAQSNILLAEKPVNSQEVDAQDDKQKGKDKRKVATSVFLLTLLNELNEVFDLPYPKLEKKLVISEDRKTVAASMLKNMITEVGVYLTRCEEELKALAPTEVVQKTLKDAYSKVVQGLFDYCATKEDEKRSKVPKRKKVYELLQTYFACRTEQDVVNLFKKIAAAIVVSRSEGINGAKSRGAELALVRFRDCLINVIFLNDGAMGFSNYSKQQVLDILESFGGVVKFMKPAEKSDEYEAVRDMAGASVQNKDNISECVEVVAKASSSECVLSMIHWLERTEDGVAGVDLLESHKEMNALRIRHLTRLILFTPEAAEINHDREFNMADYLYRMRKTVPTVINALLMDPDLTDEDRLDVALLGFIWNQFMMERKVTDKNLFTLQHLFGLPKIAQHHYLPERYKDKGDVVGLKKLYKDNVHLIGEILGEQHRDEVAMQRDVGADELTGALLMLSRASGAEASSGVMQTDQSSPVVDEAAHLASMVQGRQSPTMFVPVGAAEVERAPTPPVRDEDKQSPRGMSLSSSSGDE